MRKVTRRTRRVHFTARSNGRLFDLGRRSLGSCLKQAAQVSTVAVIGEKGQSSDAILPDEPGPHSAGGRICSPSKGGQDFERLCHASRGSADSRRRPRAADFTAAAAAATRSQRPASDSKSAVRLAMVARPANGAGDSQNPFCCQRTDRSVRRVSARSLNNPEIQLESQTRAKDQARRHRHRCRPGPCFCPRIEFFSLFSRGPFLSSLGGNFIFI